MANIFSAGSTVVGGVLLSSLSVAELFLLATIAVPGRFGIVDWFPYGAKGQVEGGELAAVRWLVKRCLFVPEKPSDGGCEINGFFHKLWSWLRPSVDQSAGVGGWQVTQEPRTPERCTVPAGPNGNTPSLGAGELGSPPPHHR